jgi:hypothetical protein
MATNGQGNENFDPDRDRSVQSGGDLGGGSDPVSGPDPDRGSPNPSLITRIWKPYDWCLKYGLAWSQKYHKFYGNTSDAKGCSALTELLARLPIGEVIEAQQSAHRMFTAFLASESPAVVRAKHPFAFFVTDFGGLRVEEPAAPGGKKLPDYG